MKDLTDSNACIQLYSWSIIQEYQVAHRAVCQCCKVGGMGEGATKETHKQHCIAEYIAVSFVNQLPCLVVIHIIIILTLTESLNTQCRSNMLVGFQCRGGGGGGGNV